MLGRVVKIISNQYSVEANGEIYSCVAMGKMRLKDKIVVNDLVEFEEYDHQFGINDIKKRKNFMIRPLIANVDQALIVMSVKDPDFSTTLIDRLIFLISAANIEPIIVVTKCDLGVSEDVRQAIMDYRNSGYCVIECQKNVYNPDFAKILDNKVSVLTGQSGAGKSSLINTYNPEYKIATQEISKALGRGKHTTRHTELYQVSKGYVADTPGFSSLDFSHIAPLQLKEVIKDFRDYQDKCHFRDCLHQNEPKCAVKEALLAGKISKTRYQNYLEVLNIIQNKKKER